MNNQDIRWEQRFSNFRKALRKLSEAASMVRLNTGNNALLLDEMLHESLVKRFEFTHELAWKVMKDYAAFQGIPDVKGARDATREAFAMRLITDGNVWMDMIRSRNLTVHTYDEAAIEVISHKIVSDYCPAFIRFEEKMSALQDQEKYNR